MQTIIIQDWHGCYDGGWGDLIVPDAYSHPAKFSRALIERIIQHGLERGYWVAGDLLADPFGGVGLGGIIAAYRGLHWLGVELEARFHQIGGDGWECPGTPSKGIKAEWPVCAECCKAHAKGLTMPPHHASGNLELLRRRVPACQVELCQGDSRRFAEIIRQCGAVVTSPPYTEGFGHGPRGLTPAEKRKRVPAQANDDDYGATPGQIGQLRAGDLKAIITSPPWENSLPGGLNCKPPPGAGKSLTTEYKERPVGTIYQDVAKRKRLADGTWPRQREPGFYNNIGCESGETYWQAMAQVYHQCLLALKPGGIMAVVVKSYCKQGKVVPLPDQTLALLVHLGFQPIERVRAWLVKENTTPGLFGAKTSRKERKSFFRHLAERKAAARELWPELDDEKREAALATSKAELGDSAKPKRLLEKAQVLALKEWETVNGNRASETDIDWEDVLFVAARRLASEGPAYTARLSPGVVAAIPRITPARAAPGGDRKAPARLRKRGRKRPARTAK